MTAPDETWLEAVSLRGRFVSLVPLTTAHAPGLSAGADAGTTEFLARGGPTAPTAEAWADTIVALNALPARVNWAVLSHSGMVLGRISYSEVRPKDGWVEIGTMLVPAGQGTAANPEAKLLLLRRAFDDLGAGRVQFKVDSLNLHSQRAMEKLGAVREGVLRQYQRRPDGRVRDSVMYSVVREEWPAVREGLERRLAQFGG